MVKNNVCSIERSWFQLVSIRMSNVLCLLHFSKFSKAPDLPVNIRSVLKLIITANALGYCDVELIMHVKSFIVQAPVKLLRRKQEK